MVVANYYNTAHHCLLFSILQAFDLFDFAYGFDPLLKEHL